MNENKNKDQKKPAPIPKKSTKKDLRDHFQQARISWM